MFGTRRKPSSLIVAAGATFGLLKIRQRTTTRMPRPYRIASAFNARDINRWIATFGVGATMTAIATMAVFPISLVNTAVLTRFLNTAEYGRLAILFFFASMVTTFLDLFIMRGVQRRVWATREDEIDYALARRIPSADAAVRDGSWKTGYEGVQVSGKRLGVLGAGKVGGQVASLGAALGMEVIVYDPYLSSEISAIVVILKFSLFISSASNKRGVFSSQYTPFIRISVSPRYLVKRQ